MKNLIIVLMVVFVTGCSSVGFQANNLRNTWTFEDAAPWNFTIDLDSKSGNCADFAVTLQYKLGEGVLYYIENPSDHIWWFRGVDAHAVLCVDGKCYDQVSSYKYDWLVESFGDTFHPMERYTYNVYNVHTGEEINHVGTGR